MLIRCVLGRVSSSTPGVTVDKEDFKDSTGNSNRWIFDIEAPYKDQVVELTLLDFRSGKPKPPGTLSPRVTAINAVAARAVICFPDPDFIKMEIVTAPQFALPSPPNEPAPGEPASTEKLLRFRVTVDGMHTLMR